jgi:glycosyltransferase involved in cell wall biosynthesis
MNSDKKVLDIYIFSPFCLLRPTTNRIFDMRLADGFAGHGERVTVVHPYVYMKDNIRKSEIPKSYGLKSIVFTSMLPTPLPEHPNSFLRLITMQAAFSIYSLWILMKSIFSRKEAVIFSRDPKLLFPVLSLKKIFGRLMRMKIIYMCAEVKDNFVLKFVLRNVNGVFAGVTSTVKAMQKLVPLPENKFMLALAPVPAFTNDCSKEEARKIIGYNSTEPLIVYTGKLGPDVNELIYILEAARLLPEFRFMATGGRQAHVDYFRNSCAEKGISNVTFTGFFNDSTYVRYYQLAADVLISYYTSKDHLVEFNYPQKLNEYLSTRNPIVTPDFEATRDIINDRNVFFAQPDNPESLAAVIKNIVSNKESAAKISNQAFEDSKGLTFESKTRDLIDFIEKIN